MSRERTGHPTSYAEVKKMKSLGLQMHGCLRASLRDCYQAFPGSTNGHFQNVQIFNLITFSNKLHLKLKVGMYMPSFWTLMEALAVILLLLLFLD